MKIRNGFVSNSSASSFCIYGVALEASLQDILVHVKKNSPETFIKLSKVIMRDVDSYKDKEYSAEVKKWLDDIDSNLDEPEDLSSNIDLAGTLEEAIGNEFEVSAPCNDSIYIGKCWSKVKDDETGKQFKDNVEKTLTGIFGKITFSTYKEAFNG